MVFIDTIYKAMQTLNKAELLITRNFKPFRKETI